MNRHVNYIIQGFLLALLIPISGFVVRKIYSFNPVKENSSIIIDYEIPQKNDVVVGVLYKGKTLFVQKCASCHQLFKDMTGPSLVGFEDRGPWRDRQNLYAWIKNPSAFMKKNSYAKALKEKYGSMMTGFPDITNEEIDNIVAYINHSANQ